MIPQYELKAEDIRAYTLNLLKDHTHTGCRWIYLHDRGHPGCHAEGQR